MKTELVTVNEAENLGLVHNRLLHRGHGAFGESDNSYERVCRIGKEEVRLSDDDLILFIGESPNREILQAISAWNCSDKLLEVFNPTALKKRKAGRLEQYLKLKKEIESDAFYADYQKD